jgi:hypothetical protein
LGKRWISCFGVTGPRHFVSVLPDGRVVWRADTGTELTALPESLVRERKP